MVQYERSPSDHNNYETEFTVCGGLKENIPPIRVSLEGVPLVGGNVSLLGRL